MKNEAEVINKMDRLLPSSSTSSRERFAGLRGEISLVALVIVGDFFSFVTVSFSLLGGGSSVGDLIVNTMNKETTKACLS